MEKSSGPLVEGVGPQGPPAWGPSYNPYGGSGPRGPRGPSWGPFHKKKVELSPCNKNVDISNTKQYQ